MKMRSLRSGVLGATLAAALVLPATGAAADPGGGSGGPAAQQTCSDASSVLFGGTYENGHVEEQALTEGATFVDGGLTVTIDTLTTKADEPSEITGFTFSVTGGSVDEVVVKSGEGITRTAGSPVQLADGDRTAISFVIFCGAEDASDGHQGDEGDDAETPDQGDQPDEGEVPGDGGQDDESDAPDEGETPGDGEDDESDTGDEGDQGGPFEVCPDTTALVFPVSDDNGHVPASELVEGAELDAGDLTVTIESVVTKEGEPQEVIGFAYSVSGGEIDSVFVKTGDGTFTDVGSPVALPGDDATAISFVAFCVDDTDQGEVPGEGDESDEGEVPGDGGQDDESDAPDEGETPGDGEDDESDTGDQGDESDDGDQSDAGDDGDESDEGDDADVSDEDQEIDEDDLTQVLGEFIERPDAPAVDDVLGAPAPTPTPAPAVAAAAADADDAETLAATGVGSTALVWLAALMLLVGAGVLRSVRPEPVRQP